MVCCRPGYCATDEGSCHGELWLKDYLACCACTCWELDAAAPGGDQGGLESSSRQALKETGT